MMAWTAPMTFVTATALTAAQLNTHLRDNFNETMVAKATTEGSMFFGTGNKALAERRPDYQRVNTSETTTSATFVDLNTVGPSVTVTTGTTAVVFLAASIGNNTANRTSYMSYHVSGATTIASASAAGIYTDGMAAATDANFWASGIADITFSLNAGVNTFTASYRVSNAGDVGVFSNRFLAVWPL